MTADDLDTCTECGHPLSEHETDAEEPRRYRKWCFGVVAEGQQCECHGFRDSNWEPDQFFEDGGPNR